MTRKWTNDHWEGVSIKLKENAQKHYIFCYYSHYA